MGTTGCLLLFFAVDAAAEKDTTSLNDWSEISIVMMVAIVCVSLLLVVFVLSLCGGCTPMEVGSDQHEAADGRKTYQYNSVATDVNTQVMSAGTTLPNDPYRPTEQALPYALHPQTENTFTGYQAQDMNQGTEFRQNQGYQAAGSNAPAGAHRHFVEEESPPPYSEAVSSSPGNAQPRQGQGQLRHQPSAPAQPYGW